MEVPSASASALAGLRAAERSLDRAASAVTRAFALPDGASGDAVAASQARLGESDPLDGVGVDPVESFVSLVAAQRAFSASLAVLRADADMQRDALRRLG
ncbi:MAG: flagellar basal body rod C-terminal domain-containing protein [Sandaracinus sp.]